ncbi:unnamed protein product [Durusdinium trenchii]|uniref:Uncharacterized protein n=1 Tax=Durusdinium trenchii TaxID=1381693 RepID=A0ABP0QMZ6_9DINO
MSRSSGTIGPRGDARALGRVTGPLHHAPVGWGAWASPIRTRAGRTANWHRRTKPARTDPPFPAKLVMTMNSSNFPVKDPGSKCLTARVLRWCVGPTFKAAEPKAAGSWQFHGAKRLGVVNLDSRCFGGPSCEDLGEKSPALTATGDLGFLSTNDLDLIARGPSCAPENKPKRALTVRLHREAIAGLELKERPAPLSEASGAGRVEFDWAPQSAKKAQAEASEAGSSGGWATVGRRGRRPRDEADVPVPAEAGPKAAEPEVQLAETGALPLDAAQTLGSGGPFRAQGPFEATRTGERTAEDERCDPEVQLQADDPEEADDGEDRATGWSGSDSEDGSSAGEWVTEEGIQPDADVRVTCATADYSVQNVPRDGRCEEDAERQVPWHLLAESRLYQPQWSTWLKWLDTARVDRCVEVPPLQLHALRLRYGGAGIHHADMHAGAWPPLASVSTQNEATLATRCGVMALAFGLGSLQDELHGLEDEEQLLALVPRFLRHFLLRAALATSPSSPSELWELLRRAEEVVLGTWRSRLRESRTESRVACDVCCSDASCPFAGEGLCPADTQFDANQDLRDLTLSQPADAAVFVLSMASKVFFPEGDQLWSRAELALDQLEQESDAPHDLNLPDPESEARADKDAADGRTAFRNVVRKWSFQVLKSLRLALSLMIYLGAPSVGRRNQGERTFHAMESGRSRSRTREGRCPRDEVPKWTINVSLPSGSSMRCSKSCSCKVWELKAAAKEFFRCPFLLMISADGQLLDGRQTLEEAHLHHGDHLTAVIQAPKMAATYGAFALWCCGGGTVTWGDAECGGDCSSVQDQLKHVQDIYASVCAFAAITADGSVVTWGHPDAGGDSSLVRDQLTNVQHIQASQRAFAALRADRSVVTWGNPTAGGDSSGVRSQLHGVRELRASAGAFAAVLSDRSVVTWGDPERGGDSSAVREQLQTVQQIQASSSAFAAVLADESVVTWGKAEDGGDSSRVRDELKHVQTIKSSACAFAAILADRSVVTWGNREYGGDSSEIQDQLKDVQEIQASECAFAAIRSDGSVVTWGDPDFGGDCSLVQDQLKNVQKIQASHFAFCALLKNGGAVTWGDAHAGGDSWMLQDQLHDVQHIHASHYAFAAVLADGSLVTWGASHAGGDMPRAKREELQVL